MRCVSFARHWAPTRSCCRTARWMTAASRSSRLPTAISQRSRRRLAQGGNTALVPTMSLRGAVPAQHAADAGESVRERHAGRVFVGVRREPGSRYGEHAGQQHAGTDGGCCAERTAELPAPAAFSEPQVSSPALQMSAAPAMPTPLRRLPDGAANGAADGPGVSAASARQPLQAPLANRCSKRSVAVTPSAPMC